MNNDKMNKIKSDSSPSNITVSDIILPFICSMAILGMYSMVVYLRFTHAYWQNMDTLIDIFLILGGGLIIITIGVFASIIYDNLKEYKKTEGE